MTITTSVIVVMTMLGWVPEKDGTLREAWRIEKHVTLEHCLTMNKFSGGGKFGAITVKCELPQ